MYKCFFKYARNYFDLSSSLFFLSWIFVLHLKLSNIDAQFVVAQQPSRETENLSKSPCAPFNQYHSFTLLEFIYPLD